MTNKIAGYLGLKKQSDQTWIDSTNQWKVIKIHKGYAVMNIPTGKVQSCVGITSLSAAKAIMRDDLLNNTSYFR
jgi:hypothetical protein